MSGADSNSEGDQAFVHALADVQTRRLGTGTKVWQFVVILPGATVGRDCNINAHCFIENDVCIGDRVTVKSGVQLWDGMCVEDDVFIGPNATFTNDRYPRSKQYPAAFQRTTIRSGASIGANATVLGGVTIGEGAMIGAGSVVTHNVPAGELWMGNPARPRGPVPARSGSCGPAPATPADWSSK
jgi:acetyltransferase-like isoleucine patch superfamily enzyme